MKNITQRAIEFRVWDKNTQHFLPIRSPHFGKGYHFNINGTLYDFYSVLEGHYGNLICQQFTGLSDKNGKKIFEGDIVKLNYDTSDVHWSVLTAEVVWWHNGFYLQVNKEGCLAQDNYYQFQKCEVIGNVFETPKLRKKS